MMQYKGYMGKVEFDPDAQVLHGEVVGIRDVITFQADSVSALRSAFEESVDDYLAFCEQRGESPDRPCSGQFLLRLTPELHRRAAMLAAANSQSLNQWVTRQIETSVQSSMAAPKRKARTARKRKSGANHTRKSDATRGKRT